MGWREQFYCDCGGCLFGVTRLEEEGSIWLWGRCTKCFSETFLREVRPRGVPARVHEGIHAQAESGSEGKGEVLDDLPF